MNEHLNVARERKCDTINEDVKFYVPVEMQVAHDIAKKYCGLILPNQNGKDSEKDFILYRPFGIEVKCDEKGVKTGNLFMEIWNSYRNEPSGLSATKAWRWAHWIPGYAAALIYCPKQMLAYCKASNWRLVIGGGDKNSDGYVAPYIQVAGLEFVSSLRLTFDTP